MTYMQRIGDMKDGSKGEYTREQESWNADYLAGYLNMDDGRKNIGDIRNQLKELYNTNPAFNDVIELYRKCLVRLDVALLNANYGIRKLKKVKKHKVRVHTWDEIKNS